ncbi:MAG: sugar ABC transporter permease, partial [Oscillospiraceae bacterium]|nr:sugar ABC transporter permease [Oscillospiraceae bacterium]
MQNKARLSFRKKKGIKETVTLPFLVMMIPGIAVLVVNNYLPMLGAIMAFQQYRFQDNFIYSIMNSRWVGFRNFQFLFSN